MQRGKLVVVEGIGKAGKSTLLARLREHLSSDEFVFTREPGGTAFGEKMRDAILTMKDLDPFSELLAIAAARFDHFQKVIVPALKEGKHVVCDRLTASTYGYQVTRLTEKQRQVFFGIETWARGKITDKDITWVYLDVPVEIAMERYAKDRGGVDKFDEAEIGQWRRVKYGIEFYLEPRDPIKIVATQTPDQVFQEVLRRVPVFSRRAAA